MCPVLILHLKGHYFKLDIFITIQHYYLSLYLENQYILIAGTFYPLAVLGIKQILAVLLLISFYFMFLSTSEAEKYRFS